MQQLSCVVVETASTANVLLNSGIIFTKTNASFSEIQGKKRFLFKQHTSCMCVAKLQRCTVSDSATSTTTTKTVLKHSSHHDVPPGFQTVYLTSALLTITPGDYPSDAKNQVTKSFFLLKTKH
jgi:hypothetical protein